ncbi:hypothetical protein BO70DRAFT_333515 [Aspergillus heteromorphus CBS 117.55]|uniref:Myb-like DNA-binding domain-containing protein n=1 Tax=Aspergillus heteromorphus CBS 117.55 TaxID=1448321 RepID=A0A317WKS1_9EURO|nr:uncharacterized protein BO70DRAFT_333515 [Aspergillus heteromorphus CBS 117.55]PWY86899.1 hypothetical protein BO70DRAFT_333515 [Aspergillus heteromorphus CBS 117.55]
MSARRSKAMPTDGPTAKFLYTIIKQLDLKSIDWSLVASQLEISNGHAARMRYSRFRQQMEGLTSKPRAPRPKKPANKAPKAGPGKAELMNEPMSSPPAVMKQESHFPVYESSHPYMKSDPYGPRVQNLADIPLASPQTMATSAVQPQMVPYRPMAISPETTMFASAPCFSAERSDGPGYPPFVHSWAPIKSEPLEGDGIFERAVKVEPPQEPN